MARRSSRTSIIHCTTYRCIHHRQYVLTITNTFILATTKTIASRSEVSTNKRLHSFRQSERLRGGGGGGGGGSGDVGGGGSGSHHVLSCSDVNTAMRSLCKQVSQRLCLIASGMVMHHISSSHSPCMTCPANHGRIRRRKSDRGISLGISQHQERTLLVTRKLTSKMTKLST